MSVEDPKARHLNETMFFGKNVDIQRFDVVANQNIERWNERSLGNFWRPDEVDVTKDKSDFESLAAHERHIFISNLKRQIVLDSVQGRAPALAFLPLTSTPETEGAVIKWSFDEYIHSRSYTHIIRNILSNPSVVFDEIHDIVEIVDLARDISRYYDALIEFNNDKKRFGSYDHKKAFWRAMFAVNMLEGVRFYVSFACSWAFAQVKNKMEGNAKIIKLICRDENEHLKLVQMILAKITKEDPDFAKIKVELNEEMLSLTLKIAEQEKSWAKYLFKDGEMLGLDSRSCCDLVDWLCDKRLRVHGMSYPLPVPQMHPMPWMGEWVSGNSRQVAPQETEVESYIIGVTDGGIDFDELSKSL